MRTKDEWGYYKVHAVTEDGLDVNAFIYAPNSWAAMVYLRLDFSHLKFKVSSASNKPMEEVWA